MAYLSTSLFIQGFETIYRRFDSTPGNTISIQGQVHVAVRTLLAKYGNEPRKGAITSITTTGEASVHSLIYSFVPCLKTRQGRHMHVAECAACQAQHRTLQRTMSIIIIGMDAMSCILL